MPCATQGLHSGAQRPQSGAQGMHCGAQKQHSMQWLWLRGCLWLCLVVLAVLGGCGCRVAVALVVAVGLHVAVGLCEVVHRGCIRAHKGCILVQKACILTAPEPNPQALQLNHGLSVSQD